MIHAFAFQNSGETRYLCLDVESGAVHELDEAAYLIARAIEENADPYAAPVPHETAEEILADFEELKAQGMFLSPEPDAGGGIAAPVIKSMCLHVAHDCNLRCRYCFASTGEYAGGRMLMSPEVGKKTLDFLIAHAGNRRNLEVDLFGGEPLMNFEVVKDIVGYGRALEKRHNKIIRFTITTNGLALNAERIAYINREMHNVVLSLDGRKSVHDTLRPTVNGGGSYDLVLKNIKALIDDRGGKEHYVRGTFTNGNLDFTEDVKKLVELGFKQISVEPVVLEPESPYAIREEHVDAILREYDKLASYVAQSRAAGEWFNFFHFMVDMEHGPCLYKRIKGCGAGVEYVAVTPDGELYPCHQFVGEEKYRLGNVMDDTFDGSKTQEFRACNIRTKPICRGCWAKYYCSGGCAANAWKLNGDIAKPEEITCTLLRKRTECAIGLNA